jgi:pyrimidine operon attenuation protein/uracil phosphoribosyltransferase
MMPSAERVIEVPERAILRNVLHRPPAGQQTARLRVVDAAQRPLPTWAQNQFFLANIGTPQEPLFLELRFEEASPGIWIALLMTNERVPRDLTAISRRIIEELERRGIAFEATIGVETLGAKLSQEIARQKGEYTLTTTFQKGKLHVSEGCLEVGPPKEWVGRDDSVPVHSGTSAFAQQALFLDQKIAAALGDASVLLVDDSRLTSGTAHASIALAQKMGLRIAAMATVMNEADLTDAVMGVPYVSLVKIPIFTRDEKGLLRPAEGSFEGVPWFYQEIE